MISLLYPIHACAILMALSSGISLSSKNAVIMSGPWYLIGCSCFLRFLGAPGQVIGCFSAVGVIGCAPMYSSCDVILCCSCGSSLSLWFSSWSSSMSEFSSSLSDMHNSHPSPQQFVQVSSHLSDSSLILITPPSS